jgi:orotidine-5'-phosphate decarboxylase
MMKKQSGNIFSCRPDRCADRRKKMINQLIANIKKTGAPVVAGLDPMMKFIPEHIQKKAFDKYGESLEGAAAAVWWFNKEIVDNIYDIIPAVKPQIAMYEQFGIPGLMAYKKTIEYCKDKGLVVIGDIKRGDIGSTSEAYAVAHLGKVKVGSKSFYSFDEDFATVNPYLGSDGVNPFIKVCQEENKGIFVLVKTSNPSSGEFQDRLVQTGIHAGAEGKDGTGVGDRPLYEIVGEYVAKWGEEHMGESYSYVGAVVGATYPEMGKVLRRIMPKTYILVPGYGAQGGKGKDLVHFFNEDGLGAIVNSSRGIIAAYQQEQYASFGPENFGQAARAAVEDMVKDISQALENR